MAQLVHFLLLAAVGTCYCAALMEMPMPEGGRLRRAPEDNWPAIYPSGFYLQGGVYASKTNGFWATTGEIYNDRPVYKGGNNDALSVYYRVSGGATDMWVLDFNDVSEEWEGTVAIQSTLFASEV